MNQRIKQSLLGNPLGRSIYGRVQEAWFDRDYRHRRERYDRLVGADSRVFRPEEAWRRARLAVETRGYSISRRSAGEVHTFACIPSNWSHQNQIAASLERFGPVSRFDYCQLGVGIAELRTRVSGSRARRREIFEALLQQIRSAQERQPIDWFLSYSTGWDMSEEILSRLKNDFGFPLVNISLDDKNWWDEVERGDAQSGLKNIAPHYDLGWTSARSVIPWYWAEGGQAIFLPEGANVDWFRPLEIAQDIPVGFVGNRFGHRPETFERLRKAGIPVLVRGPGWVEGTLSDQEMLEFFNRCQINLGLGEMHFSRVLTNLKGRDFEVPATGRGLYLTSFNSDLAGCFDIGSEIQCYRGFEELVDQIRRHLADADQMRQMAARARERCVRQHQWFHRVEVILRGFGIL